MKLFILIISPILLLSLKGFSERQESDEKKPVYIIFKPEETLLLNKIPEGLNWYGIEKVDSIDIRGTYYLRSPFNWAMNCNVYALSSINVNLIQLEYSGFDQYYYKAEFMGRKKYLFVLGINRNLKTDTTVFDEGPFIKNSFKGTLEPGFFALFSPPGAVEVAIAVTGKIELDTTNFISNAFNLTGYTISYVKQYKRKSEGYLDGIDEERMLLKNPNLKKAVANPKMSTIKYQYRNINSLKIESENLNILNLDEYHYKYDPIPKVVWYGKIDEDELPDLILMYGRKYENNNALEYSYSYQLILSSELKQYSNIESYNCTIEKIY